jgi:putative redox protein
MGKKTNTGLEWKGNMSFEAEVTGHKFMIDADAAVGGQDKGPRPKPLMLAALSGCTAMDVIPILKKMRVTPDAFRVDVEANNTEEHPKHYDAFTIFYKFKGKDLPKDKIEKAVSLSQERYCGVSYMLAKAAHIDYKIIIEE